MATGYYTFLEESALLSIVTRASDAQLEFFLKQARRHHLRKQQTVILREMGGRIAQVYQKEFRH